MRESKIERHLKIRIHRLGGECIKMGQDGWPDRLVILPGGEATFVETKATEGKVKPWQARRHVRLRELVQEVFVPHSIEEIDKKFPHES
jgi:hypothetical protein